jgi:adenine-specific DNA-methyltransferase
LLNPSAKKIKLDSSVRAVAEAIGKAAAQIDHVSASHQLGNLYTSLLPAKIRSNNGVFYTPPVLSRRLIEMATEAGVNWATASVADPACGGGAFLAPVALEIVKAKPGMRASSLLNHIETHLKGYELDYFAAWLTQVFLEVVLKDVITAAKRRMQNVVTVCNTLDYPFSHREKFDLVIGNPPYGKVGLSEEIKKRYHLSLYGHPNLYGLFTHLAIDIAKPGGVISYLTPTSFLSGEYFKKLRQYIRENTAVIEADLVAVRKDVFEDVLQETMLTTYYKHNGDAAVQVNVQINELITLSDDNMKLEVIGNSPLPQELIAPWLLPKTIEQVTPIKAMAHMPSRLKDWGYKIITGQLVWNRHKEQLTNTFSKNCYPLIWAEAITQEGNFVHRADKTNHTLWFKQASKSEFLLTKNPCVLLQRTTSKEQDKRLIAAVLPSAILDKYGAVVVENHVNIITAINSAVVVTLEVLSAFLNSKAVNDAFRTISGSVAVSAYELEAFPIPHISQLARLQNLVENNAAQDLIEQECLSLYTTYA